MNFLEKLDILMEKSSLNKHTFAEASGIPYTTIVNFYATGYDKMRMSTMWKIADFFHVSIDYLMRDDIEKPEDFTPNGNTASTVCNTPEETELITMFRSLNRETRDIVMSTVRGFAGNPSMQKDGDTAKMA